MPLTTILHHDKILQTLEERNITDSIYLDFAKAFDKVDHGIFSHKLQKLGIGGKLCTWIANLCNNRVQKVLVNGEKSRPSLVKSRGTVLGPILFLVLILDIDTNISSKETSFADDTRVMRKIKYKELKRKFNGLF